MLIHVNEDERIPSLIDWCNKIVKKIFLEGDGLNQQQINVLEMMDKNNYTIIKSYRRAGLTTLMLMKMAYDILYRFEAYPLKIQYISHSKCAVSNALDNFMHILDSCDEKIYYEISGLSVKLYVFDRKYIINFCCDKTLKYGDVLYNDVYIDNANFIKFEDGFSELLLTNNFYSHVNIGSIPHKKNSTFYDFWNDATNSKNHFKPIALKWYMDSRFNKNLKAITKDGNVKRIDSFDMVLDSLENGYEITNEWMESYKKINNNVSSEINSKFID